MSRLWALVPLKNLASAKTRLANALTGPERRALVMAMARDVTAALANSRAVERVILVSDIPDLPRRLGVPGVVSHIGTGVRGLNEDLGDAALWAGTQGATHVLIAHADLPLLTPALVDRFVGPAGGDGLAGGLRAACCKHGTGTNLLLAPLPLPLPLVFGSGSLAHFRSIATAAGIDFEVRRDPMLAQDIDESSDYEVLQGLCRRGSFKHSATAALLREDRARRLRTGVQADLHCETSSPGRLALSSA